MKEVTVTISSKGQLAIPKAIRTQLGIHAGTQLLMYVKDGDILEMHPFKRSIEMFFGKGKHKNVSMTVGEMDEAIAEAVAENDRY